MPTIQWRQLGIATNYTLKLQSIKGCNIHNCQLQTTKTPYNQPLGVKHLNSPYIFLSGTNIMRQSYMMFHNTGQGVSPQGRHCWGKPLSQQATHQRGQPALWTAAAGVPVSVCVAALPMLPPVFVSTLLGVPDLVPGPPQCLQMADASQSTWEIWTPPVGRQSQPGQNVFMWHEYYSRTYTPAVPDNGERGNLNVTRCVSTTNIQWSSSQRVHSNLYTKCPFFQQYVENWKTI